MDVLVSFSSSSGSEAVSSLLTELNDSHWTVYFESDRFAAFLSFDGGDKARLVAPSYCDAAWAAVQHGITAAFAFEALQAAVEGVEEGVSGLSANFSSTWIGGSYVSAQVPVGL